MNCSICEIYLADYLDGILPPDLIHEVQNHLEDCVNCKLLYDALLSTNQLIAEEKGVIPSSGLTDRVMVLVQQRNRIVAAETNQPGIFQPLLIAASITIAVLAGIRVGNLYYTTRPAKQVPVELSLMDDFSMESVDMITRD
jgi:predicted anti-sigma-YlaC factor YlaD